jgi:hypothetical protein
MVISTVEAPVLPEGRTVGGEIARWAHDVGVADVFTYPSVGVDAVNDHLAAGSDGLRVTIAASERSAAAAAEALAALTGRAVAVVMDCAWAGEVRPPLLETGTVHHVAVGVDQPGGWAVAPARGGASPAPPTGTGNRQGRPVVAVLPPPHHPHRARALDVVASRGVPAATCVGWDPFPRSHRHLWVGRVGFLPTPHLLSLAESTSAGIGWAALPGAVIPEWLARHAEPTSPDQLSEIPAADRVEPAVAARPHSPLARVTDWLSDALPESLVVADAGAAHRVVAAHVANRGRRALLTDCLTPMGWSLAAALGAARAEPAALQVAVIGDGSLLASVADLAVLAKCRVPAVVVLARNGTLGNRPGRPGDPLCDPGLPGVDWLGLAAAVGIPAVLADPEDPEPGCRSAMAGAQRGRRPSLLIVDTPPSHPQDLRDRVGIDHVDALFTTAASERRIR